MALRHNRAMLKSFITRFTRPPVDIPAELWEETLAAYPFLARLAPDAREKLRELAQELLVTKQMAGAGELELTAAMQVAIAAQACLPVLELGLDWYRGWSSIVVYPGEFIVPRRLTDDAGVVHEYEEPISGEAWEGGPLLLSWADAQANASESGSAYSVVIHEFAHKLDMLDGEADGVPPFSAKLHAGLDLRRWRATLDDAYGRFVAELQMVEHELPAHLDPESADADAYYAHLPLDPYAAQEPGEFFAVSAEAFFVAPDGLQRAFPDWYALLAAFFRQDPQRVQ